MTLTSLRFARYRRGAGEVLARRMRQRSAIESGTYMAITNQGGISWARSRGPLEYTRYNVVTALTNTRTNACPRSWPRILPSVGGSHLKGAINFDTRLVANMPFSLCCRDIIKQQPCLLCARYWVKRNVTCGETVDVNARGP